MSLAPPVLVPNLHVDEEAARALDAYVRVVCVVRAYKAGKPLETLALQRVAQRCADSVLEDPDRKQRLWNPPAGEEIAGFRAANACFVALSFGHQLGLTNAQQRELALATLVQALHSDLRHDELFKGTRIYDRSWMLALETEAETERPFGLPFRDALGTPGLFPLRPLPLYSRIARLCLAYETQLTAESDAPAKTPEEALLAMKAEPARFDPALLSAFEAMVRAA